MERKQLGHYESESASALIAEDGRSVAIEFKVGGDQTIAFGLSTEAAAALQHQLSLHLSATIPASRGGPGFVRTTPVTSATAAATDAPDKVVLCLQTAEGIPHYFEMPAQASAELRPQLRAAENSSRSGVKLPRA